MGGFGDGETIGDRLCTLLGRAEDALLRLVGWGRRLEYAPGDLVRIRHPDYSGYLDRRGVFFGVIKYPAEIYRGPVYVTDVYDPREGAWRRPGPWSARDMRPLDDPTDAELLILLEREVTR